VPVRVFAMRAVFSNDPRGAGGCNQRMGGHVQVWGAGWKRLRSGGGSRDFLGHRLHGLLLRGGKRHRPLDALSRAGIMGEESGKRQMGSTSGANEAQLERRNAGRSIANRSARAAGHLFYSYRRGDNGDSYRSRCPAERHA